MMMIGMTQKTSILKKMTMRIYHHSKQMQSQQKRPVDSVPSPLTLAVGAGVTFSSGIEAEQYKLNFQ